MLSDHVLWLTCLAFYAADCLRHLRPDSLLLQEGRRRTWEPVLPILPSQAATRTFGLLDLFRPWRATIAVSWIDGFGQPVHGQRRQVREKIATLEPLRLVGQLEFFCLFVYAPFVTWRWGLPAAILGVAAAHLLLSLVVLAVTILRIRRKDVTVAAGLGLWFECLVCPGHQANVFRRALLREAPLEVDALALMRRNTDRAKFVPGFVNYVEVLNEEGVVDARLVAACRSLVETRGTS